MANLPNFPSCGDNFNWMFNGRTKVPDAGYTAPLVGDLVTQGTNSGNSVLGPATNGVIAGIVDSTNQGNGLLTVTELIPGTTIELPYTGAVAYGNKVKMNGSAQDTVLGRTVVVVDNTNGTGFIIGIDADCPHGTGFVVVRF